MSVQKLDYLQMTVLYRSVENESDCACLQDDLARLEQWEDSWCMSFNADKCSMMSITRKRKSIVHHYILHNKALERDDSATYLGVEMSSNLSWANHINKICKKANLDSYEETSLSKAPK